MFYKMKKEDCGCDKNKGESDWPLPGDYGDNFLKRERYPIIKNLSLIHI